MSTAICIIVSGVANWEKHITDMKKEGNWDKNGSLRDSSIDRKNRWSQVVDNNRFEDLRGNFEYSAKIGEEDKSFGDIEAEHTELVVEFQVVVVDIRTYAVSCEIYVACNG